MLVLFTSNILSFVDNIMKRGATQKHPLFVLPRKMNEINITPHLHVKYRAKAKAEAEEAA